MPGKPGKWANLRLPKTTLEKLEAIQEILTNAHVNGYTELPDQYAEHLPLHAVIERAAIDWLKHRERSRRTNRRPKRHAR